MCKYLFENNYGVWVCGYNNRFKELGTDGMHGPGACDVCEDYTSGEKTEEMYEAFRKYDKKNTEQQDEAEYLYWRNFDMSGQIHNLNDRMEKGKMTEEEILLDKQEIEKEYGITLEKVYDEKCYWSSKPRWIYSIKGHYEQRVKRDEYITKMF